MILRKVYEQGDTVKATDVIVDNQIGGSDKLIGSFDVKIRHVVNDEMGIRYIGELINQNDIIASRKLGESNLKPEDLMKFGTEVYESAKRGYEKYDPKIVYFAEGDIVEFVHGEIREEI